ncbi:MAG: metalloregulator ArsR/SmtB family transcription factor [Pedobacter sp.]|nr:metalloregulator ArsR/SmtB family transcription factor [Pedobacter sp.]
MVDNKSAALDDVFVAMADETRRAILARLAQSEARVTEIAGDFPISLNAVSKHIKILERAGLVLRTVQGREHVLSLNAAPMADAMAWMNYYRQFWDERLKALDAFVMKKQGQKPQGRKPQ